MRMREIGIVTIMLLLCAGFGLGETVWGHDEGCKKKEKAHSGWEWEGDIEGRQGGPLKVKVRSDDGYILGSVKIGDDKIKLRLDERKLRGYGEIDLGEHGYVKFWYGDRHPERAEKAQRHYGKKHVCHGGKHHGKKHGKKHFHRHGGKDGQGYWHRHGKKKGCLKKWIKGKKDAWKKKCKARKRAYRERKQERRKCTRNKMRCTRDRGVNVVKRPVETDIRSSEIAAAKLSEPVQVVTTENEAEMASLVRRIQDYQTVINTNEDLIDKNTQLLDQKSQELEDRLITRITRLKYENLVESDVAEMLIGEIERKRTARQGAVKTLKKQLEVNVQELFQQNKELADELVRLKAIKKLKDAADPDLKVKK
ncbi:hypothetical protein [Poriferisphaera corsica]|nr:hypothetical protein [Poriferisphaera corsica]